MTYRYSPRLPAGVDPGHFGITQVIAIAAGFTPGAAAPPVDGRLDNCHYLALHDPGRRVRPSARAFVTISPGGTQAFEFTDAPNANAGPHPPPGVRLRVETTLLTFLMFVPDRGVPVALGFTIMHYVAVATHANNTNPTEWRLARAAQLVQPTHRTTASANRVYVPIWDGLFDNSGGRFACPKPTPPGGLGTPPAPPLHP